MKRKFKQRLSTISPISVINKMNNYLSPYFTEYEKRGYNNISISWLAIGTGT